MKWKQGCEILQRKNQEYILTILFERGGKRRTKITAEFKKQKDTLNAKGSRGSLTKQRIFNIQVF